EDLGIQIGSRIIWNPATKRRNKHFVGKAMDDRAALAILEQFLTEVDKSKLGCELWVASTVMEEMGTVGAASGNNGIDARYAMALDVALCGDIPAVDWLDVPVKLGGGPVIVQKDLLSYTRSVTRAIEAAAEDAEIPFQRAVFNLYGSDAGELIRK